LDAHYQQSICDVHLTTCKKCVALFCLNYFPCIILIPIDSLRYHVLHMICYIYWTKRQVYHQIFW